MIRITAYIKPHRLEQVKSAIAALGVTGMNVADVRGSGNSPEPAGPLSGTIKPLPIRSRICVVVEDDLQEPVVEAIAASAKSGESGDGKIFVERVLDAVRIRTQERGILGL